eukprot:UC4_evm1s1313
MIMRPRGWTTIFTGLSAGISIKGTNNCTRLIICCNHNGPDPDSKARNAGRYSSTLYSDDHGITWNAGENVKPPGSTECNIGQNKEGIWMYSRLWNQGTGPILTHGIAKSLDFGKTFPTGLKSYGTVWPQPDCEGTIRVTEDCFFLSSPYGTGRMNMTLSRSCGRIPAEPADWNHVVLWPGPSAYSSMEASSQYLYVAYERGSDSSFKQLNAFSSEAVKRFGHFILPQFMMDPNYTNLNQGSYGTVPRRVFEAQIDILRQVESNPDGFLRSNIKGDGGKGKFQSLIDNARRLLAKFISAEDRDLVFVENASSGLNAVLRSVTRFFSSTQYPNERAKKVLYLDLAYGEVQEIMKYLAGDIDGAAKGTLHEQLVLLNTSELFPDNISDDSIIDLINKTIRNHPDIGFASFSHIVSIPGIILPIKRIVKLCHDHGILVLVDGAHAPGQIHINVTDIGADFYVGN